MKKFHIFIVISLIILTSFSDEVDRELKIPDVRKCHTLRLVADEELRSPLGMIVIGNHLVVYDTKAEDSFKVYNLPAAGGNISVIPAKSVPGSFNNADVKSFVPQKDGFQLFEQDLTLNRLSFKEGELPLWINKEIPYLAGPLNGIQPFKNGYINLNPTFDGYDYYDMHTGEKSVFCMNPEWDDGVENNPNVLLRASSAAVHPDGEHLATFYIFHNKIIYYDSDGEVQKEISLPLDGVHDNRWKESPVFYLNIIAANKRWIVVNYGNKEYHFFDWKGHLLRRIKLDKKLFPVTFDFSSNTFYGIDNSASPMQICSAKIRFKSFDAISYKTGTIRIIKK